MSLGCGPAIVNRIPYVFTDGHCTATVTATVRPLYGHCTATVRPLYGHCMATAASQLSAYHALQAHYALPGDFRSTCQPPRFRVNVCIVRCSNYAVRVSSRAIWLTQCSAREALTAAFRLLTPLGALPWAPLPHRPGVVCGARRLAGMWRWGLLSPSGCRRAVCSGRSSGLLPFWLQKNYKEDNEASISLSGRHFARGYPFRQRWYPEVSMNQFWEAVLCRGFRSPYG